MHNHRDKWNVHINEMQMFTLLCSEDSNICFCRRLQERRFFCDMILNVCDLTDRKNMPNLVAKIVYFSQDVVTTELVNNFSTI